MVLINFPPFTFSKYCCSFTFLHQKNSVLIHVGVVDTKGRTPLAIAVARERLNVVDYLITEQNIHPESKQLGVCL